MCIRDSFYKDKLLKYLNIIKDECHHFREKFVKQYLESGKEFDLFELAQKLHIAIILRCGFGESMEDCSLDYNEGGQIVRKPIGMFMAKIMNDMILRNFSP